MYGGHGSRRRDATDLISRDEFFAFWNTLSFFEKEFYLKMNLPKRVFKRRLTPSEDR